MFVNSESKYKHDNRYVIFFAISIGFAKASFDLRTSEFKNF